MTKIVINRCYGGFSLSEAATARYRELGGVIEDDYARGISRSDPLLARVVEELGRAAWGHEAALVIVELPVGTRYRIKEYDGIEWIETDADINWSIA